MGGEHKVHARSTLEVECCGCGLRLTEAVEVVEDPGRGLGCRRSWYINGQWRCSEGPAAPWLAPPKVHEVLNREQFRFPRVSHTLQYGEEVSEENMEDPWLVNGAILCPECGAARTAYVDAAEEAHLHASGEAHRLLQAAHAEQKRVAEAHAPESVGMWAEKRKKEKGGPHG